MIKGFLKEIKIVQQERIKEKLKKSSFQVLRYKAEALKTDKSFIKALEKAEIEKKPGIIAEIKKASPSKGDIRADIDPAVFAKTYEKAGACAVSVLTEQVYFKGSLRDLDIAANSVTIPVLRKDFIISSFQIFEARAAGASSVLLINKLLEATQLKEYIDLARQINMEPLVEIHSEQEIESVLTAGAKIIAINNRDLETLETDINVSKRVAPFFTENIIPVEASGISSFFNIQESMKSNIYNFLVGENIVKADDPKTFIRKLINLEACGE